ncbi:serine/threonine-protein kinase, partial [Streptomyces sp. NPDC032472]|uniref:serine/threonine-protein kinase n=1 Tax=Streptomyces sp. NPDC032472 TaxID=3155018 RepID=UPI0033DE6433
GLVHRDLKPGNIILAEDGPRVLDFGIARAVESTRMTATGTAFGTPGYLAPEQALGLDVTGAADVFALGSVLVAAAGGSAWGEGTPMGLMYRSVHEPPNLAAVPDGLRALVEACLAKDPADRPTPSALLDLLGDPEAPVIPVAQPPVPQAPPPQNAAPQPAAPHTPAPQPALPQTPVPPVPTVLQASTPPTPVPATQAAPPRPQGPPPMPAVAPAVPAGPVEAAPDVVIADRRNSVVADAAGVVLEVDGVEADFAWEELAGITYAPLNRGAHLVVTVLLPDGSSYGCQVNARRVSRLQEWLGQLHRSVVCHLAPRLGVLPGPYGFGPGPYGSGAPGMPGPYGGFGSPQGPGGFGPPPPRYPGHAG